MEAQAPAPGNRPTQPKIPQGTDIKIATAIVRGLKQPGKREEIERWMTQNTVDIMGIQETHCAANSKEKRREYSWYLNGTEEGNREFAGVGIIINNKWGKYVKDVIPHSHRIVELQLEGVAPISIVTVYAPQAGRTQTDKE